ncbi:hypothetical protein SLS62_004208 [Diatrype stigma]|uniref:C4-dicarboxylate transporter/malic acid transport protein n=1 Tax=Diatrype stigma TaxID=117547 RepID=A0AAN9YTC9_9PEZI
MVRDANSELTLEAVMDGYVTPREEHFVVSTGALRELGRERERERERERDRDRDRDKSPHSTGRFEAHDPNSLARMISNARKSRFGKKIGIRDRICCYQWTWFTMTMATGGIANVFHSIWSSYGASWLYYLGLFFFLFNLCLFIMNCILIAMRFWMVPGSFYHSFRDQVESLFIPAVVVSTGTILINICEYGIPYSNRWLVYAMECLFWIYTGISVIASAVWVFPAYPLLLSAPFASNLITSTVQAAEAPGINFTPIAFCSITVQGTGFLISFMICAAFIYRLMTQKLPRDMQRPGVFISIGPSGFTVAGIVALGQQSAVILPQNFEGEEHAVFILRVISILVGLWLWGLSLWFFLVSVGSLWKYVRPESTMPFQMTWWSFVFPNTALVTATLALAKALDSAGLRIFGCVMAACLILVWLLVFVTMIRCLWRRQLLWPKELEDTR